LIINGRTIAISIFLLFSLIIIKLLKNIFIMNEEIQMLIEETIERMEHAISHLDHELAHIRAGKASPRMIESVHVDYYGSMTPIMQVSNVSTPDARTIAIQPWEKKMIQTIERAIINSNLGFNPENNGEIIRINVPVPTEERRRNLVKDVNKEGEIAKVSIRSARKDANDHLKKMLKAKEISEDMEKDTVEEIQQLTDNYTKKVDSMMSAKEKEILTV
jgi:ribosome recycling factor